MSATLFDDFPDAPEPAADPGDGFGPPPPRVRLYGYYAGQPVAPAPRPTGKAYFDRLYQTRAVERIFEEWKSWSSTLVVMATGTGKTVVIGNVVKRVLAGEFGVGRGFLFVAHRTELINQAAKTFRGMFPAARVEIEKAEQVATDRADIVVASVQTLAADRLAGFRKDRFAVVAIDEAHHAVRKNATYNGVLTHFTDCFVLGVTATPDREDESSLGVTFQSVAFTYDILEAISDGWLVPLGQSLETCVDLDYSRLKKNKEGDYSTASVSAEMTRERPLVAVVDAAIKFANMRTKTKPTGRPTRPTIIFAASTDHAKRIAEMLNRKHAEDGTGRAAYMDCKLDRQNPGMRAEVIEMFRRGDIQYLVNFGLFTEGFDAPEACVVVIARPTKSRALYAQMCLDSETEILTRRGWVGRGVIRSDDEAADYDTATGEIGWSSVEIIERGLLPGEVFCRVVGPGVDIRVTDRHDLLVSIPKGRKRKWPEYRKVFARDVSVLPGQYRMPVCGVEPSAGVPLTDDELRFVGWVLTDGSVNPVNGQITITQKVGSPGVEKIASCLIGCGFKFTRKTIERENPFNPEETVFTEKFTVSRGKPRGRDKHLTGWDRLAAYVDKEISPELDNATPEQLGVLLEAVNAGDGSKRSSISWTQRTYQISTGRKRFADRLQSLCTRRGFRCHVSEGSWNQNPIYILNIKPQNFRSFSNREGRTRWVTETPRDGEMVWCVRTRRGTIVTRRQGKVIVMGNCGRVTRPLEEVVAELSACATAAERKAVISRSRKPGAMVVDVVGLEHKLVITAADILGGQYDDAAVAMAKKKLAGAGYYADVEAELKRAQAAVERQKREEAEREAAKRRAGIIVDAKLKSRRVDPFSVLDATAGREPGWFAGKEISDAQKSKLIQWGVPARDLVGMSRHQASQLMGICLERFRAGYCTYRQAKILKNHGYEPNVSRGEAKRIIDDLKANNWHKVY